MTTLPILAPSANSDAGATLAGGVALFSLFFMIAGAILAITWIIFPFIVIAKCNEIAYIGRQILYELQCVRTQMPPAAPQIPPAAPRTPIAPVDPPAIRKPLPPLPNTGPGIYDRGDT